VPGESADGKGGRPDQVAPRSRSNRTVTPAIAAALVVLAASFALSVAFVLANGGLDLPAAQRPSSPSAAVGAAPGPVATSTDVAQASPAAASPGPTTSGTPGAPTAKPTPSPTAKPTPGATPRSSSNRYDLLTACPNMPDCWVYVVRQGDNLFSIARYFGVPLSAVEERNPWTRTSQLVAGQKLLLPPPTR
jgi:LysM repeat protein